MFSEGEVILVSYTARDRDSGRVHDTTSEKEAKEAGIWNQEREYRPLPVVFGQGNVFEKLENELKGMGVGESKKVLMEAKEAFGERNPELIRIVALKAFHEKKIAPFPGLVVEVDGKMGRIQSVSGGRVRVDFNHELAGKELEYEIKVEKRLESGLEIIRALAQKYFSFLPKEQLVVEQEEARAKETEGAEEDKGEGKIIVKMPKQLVGAKEFKELEIEFERIASRASKVKVEFGAIEGDGAEGKKIPEEGERPGEKPL